MFLFNIEMTLRQPGLHNLQRVQCSIYTVPHMFVASRTDRFLEVYKVWVHNEQAGKSKSYEKNAILHMYLASSSDTSLKVLSSNTDTGPPLWWFAGQGCLDCFDAGTSSRFPWLLTALFSSTSSSSVLLLVLGITNLIIHREAEKILLPTTSLHSNMLR